MRNLKRALSLTLASVMLLGMMVVGSSALSFNDADDISNVTAASVLEDLGIMQGDGSGNFMPDKAVTRAQMAIIVCRILYGNKLNVSQFEGTTQYTDVGANDYYTGYINLATQLGIIGGYGDGRFGPNDTVTTAQAALMLSRALGYFKGNEIAQATDWALASIAQATKINMFGNLNLPTNAELARDNVAEMVFNAITKTVPVQYNELLGVYYNENQGIIYSLEFNYLQTLGYKNFDLVYKSDTRDMYGRPATTWGVGRYNAGNSTTSSGTITKTDQLTTDGGLKPSLVRLQEKDEIITVPNVPTYVYTNKTNEKDVYSDLGKTVCTDTTKDKDRGYVWTAYVNGKEVEEKVAGKDGKDLIPKSGTAGDKRYIYTAKGTQTEIYIDDDEQTVDVIEINYYIGQVSSVKEDSNGRYVTVKELSEGSKLNLRTFFTSDYAEDDYVIYTIDYVEDDKDYVIGEMFEPEIVTGEINRVEKDKASSDTYLRFEANGTKYPYSCFTQGEDQQQHMVYDLDELNSDVHPELKVDYDLLMDPIGYVVAFREANQKPNQYLYVKDSDEELRDWIAKVLLTDTTSAKVEVKDELDNLDDSRTETYYHPQLNNATPAENEVKFINAEVDWVDYELLGGTTGTKASNIDQLIWKYSVSDSGVYTLKFIEPQKDWDKTEDKDTQWYMTNAKIETGKAYVTGDRPNADGTTKKNNEFIVDAKTVFVDDANDKVYTGYKEVPNVDNARVAYVLNKGVAKVVFILDGDIYDDSNVYFMLKEEDRETFKYDGDNYWDFEEAYVNGEKQSHFYVRTNALNGGAHKDELNLKVGHLYKVEKTIEDGEYVTKIVEWTDANGRALPQALLTINAVGAETFWLDQYNENTPVKYDTEGGDDPTQIVLVEYDADGKLDNITTGRLSDMKNGQETTKYKETQKDEDGNKVTIDTWAVVVKAKSTTGKDATTARVVYIVNRPVEFFYKDASGETKMGLYDYSTAVDDGKFAVTVDAPKLGAGEVINEIIICDADGKIIDRITKNIPEIVNGDITLVVPEDAAEIEFVTGEYVPPVDETKAAITVNFDAGVESVVIGETTVTTSGGKAVVTKGEPTDMTINLKENFEIKNVAGATLKAENVYTINVSEDGTVSITTNDASQQKLTLAGLLGLKDNVKVYVNEDLYSDTIDVEDKVSGIQSTYTVPADAKIVIKLKADSSITAAKTVKVGETSVTLKDGGADWGDTIEFTMPKTALTLNLAAADTMNDGDSAANEVVTITLNNGVTAQYKEAGAGKEYVDVVSGKPVTKGGTLKITGKGTGAAVVGALTVAGNSSGAASVTDLATKALETVATDGTELTGTVDSSIELWSATVVKTTGTDVTAKGKVLAANDADASATKTNGIYIPVDTTLTIAGGDFDGYVVTNETGIMHAGESQATLTVTGTDAWNIYGATKLSMGEGVQATYDTNKHPVDGDFVNAAQEVTFTAVKGDGTEDAEKVVVKDKADKGYGSAVTDPEAVDGDETYVAYTKVTLKINGGKLEIANPVITGKFLTILTGTSAADGDVIGIAKGTPIIITGSAAADEKIKVSEGATDKTSDYVIDGSDTIGTATSAPEASIEVGEKALTIEQA